VNKKRYPPILTDEVWRLEKIGKNGAFHNKLSENNINNIQDFLKLWIFDPARLRHVSSEIWSWSYCYLIIIRLLLIMPNYLLFSFVYSDTWKHDWKNVGKSLEACINMWSGGKDLLLLWKKCHDIYKLNLPSSSDHSRWCFLHTQGPEKGQWIFFFLIEFSIILLIIVTQRI
jgi:Calmodulin binding protein-like